MRSSKEMIEQTEKYGAHNYHPKEVVFWEAEGAVAVNPEGEKFYDMLSAYSAHNFGHRHPEIIQAAREQLDRVTLTSRAFHNAVLGDFLQKLCELTGKEMALPMNTGAEAVETALKTARRWGNRKKNIPDGCQEIICCEDNFHGRTITVITMSTDPNARKGFGPFTPGFVRVPFGDAKALEQAITPHTCAFLCEPIQGEAGIRIPPEGYLRQVREICRRHGILWIADEVQTGLARTGRMFACDHEDVKPDIYVLGKALGGGILPVSAVTADREILDVYDPGSHGSTFGGNPLAAAVGLKAMEILVRDKYPQMAENKGRFFLERLRRIQNPDILEIRGRGLLIGMEFRTPAAKYVEKIIAHGVLTKETHENTIRFAPPLVISYGQLEDAAEKIRNALEESFRKRNV